MIGGSIISSSKTITIGCEFNMLVCLLGHPRCRTLSLCSPENGKRGWGEVTPCVTLLKAWNWSTNGRYWKLKLNLVLTQLNANQGTGHTICEKPARASCVIFHQCSVNMTTFYKPHFHKLWKLLSLHMEHNMSLVAVKCLMMLRRKRVGEKRGRIVKSCPASSAVRSTALHCRSGAGPQTQVWQEWQPTYSITAPSTRALWHCCASKYPTCIVLKGQAV